MAWHQVDVKKDHLERLIRKPLAGVTELVWNAVDADATEVRVTLAEGGLGGINEVRVADDGVGMTPEFAIEVFSGLGGSWKAHKGRSDDGRPLHGRGRRGPVEGIRHRSEGPVGHRGRGRRSPPQDSHRG